MSLELLNLLHLHQRPGECLQGSESVCRPFKRAPGFAAALCLTRMDRVLTDCHYQMLWGYLFPEQDPLSWGAQCGAVTPYSSGGLLLLICPSQCSITTYVFGVSPIQVSTPPTSLDVASSLCPQLLVLFS